jgi:hypothetical protein
MSLSYLKTEPTPQKHEKIPKPENIAALREALLSVMKNEGITAQSAQPTQSTQANSGQPQSSSVEPSTHHSARNSHSTTTKTNPSDPTEHRGYHKSHDDTVKHHENVKHKTSADTTTHKDSAKVTKEVEESELKDIFAE